jgi:hypothetical protein
MEKIVGRHNQRLRAVHYMAVILLSVWMALFAPLLCLKHGLMLGSTPVITYADDADMCSSHLARAAAPNTPETQHSRSQDSSGGNALQLFLLLPNGTIIPMPVILQHPMPAYVVRLYGVIFSPNEPPPRF